MADIRWAPTAKPTFDTKTITPGGTIGTETFTITINNKDITYTASGGDAVADVVDGLLAAWETADDTIAEYAEMTPSDATTHLALVAQNSGVPITVTSSASGLATLVTATTTAGTGPNDINNADNWSGGAVPGNSDDVYVDNSDIPMLYNLGALSAVTFASVRFGRNLGQNFSCGLPEVNASGGYVEYRATELAAGATSFIVENDSEPRRIKWNFGSVQTAAVVKNAGTSAENNVPAVILRGTHADNTLEVQNGTVGIGYYGGQAATFKTNLISGGEVKFGPDCTLNGTGATYKMTGGDVQVRSNLLTTTIEGGVIRVDDAATVSALTVEAAGTCFYRSTGTCTAATIRSLLDLSEDISGRTFTDLTLDGDGRYVDPGESLTVTNNIQVGSLSRGLASST